MYDKNIDYSKQMQDAVSRGDYVAAAKAEQARNEKITAEKLPYAQSYAYQGFVTPSAASGSDAYERYKSSMQSALDAYNASVDSGLRSQQLVRDDTIKTAGQQLEQSNRAASTAYQRSVNPFGYNAQAMAASGLSGSGVSESSRIAAGNGYQQAINANNTTFADTQRAANLAYQQAAAEAEVKKQQYLASNLQEQASSGLSFGQWQAEQDQANRQYLMDYAIKKATLDDQLATNKISRAQYEAELEKIKAENALYQQYAGKQADADYQQTLADIAYTKAQTAKLNRS